MIKNSRKFGLDKSSFIFASLFLDVGFLATLFFAAPGDFFLARLLFPFPEVSNRPE